MAMETTISEKNWIIDRTGQENVDYKDRSGNILTFYIYNGIHYNSFFPLRCIKQMKGFSMRKDDVYLAGYQRTGTNWTHERISMLLNGNAETVPYFKPHLDILPKERLDALSSPRIISCHTRLSDAPDDIRDKRCKVIFTLRDPKDVIVSMYKMIEERPWEDNAYKGSFEDFVYLFLEGKADHNGLFDHWRDAEKYFLENKDIPVYYHIYEKASQEPVTSVQKLSDFLDQPRNDDLCRTIAHKCEFARMKVDKSPFTIKLGGEDVIYRQGIIGDWKNYFSEEMLVDYYKEYDLKMSGSRFYDLYSQKKSNLS